MVDIEINGIAIKARDGAMVIEAADEAGIAIPRFCYHKKLSIAASCRMCLVEVEKVAKPLPACATPVTEGMKVFTRSPKALSAQKGVMEFLLINHPLDCPICDQGGECDLQEMAMGYGKDVSRYTEKKRIVGDKSLGSLIATDMTRCIHCTRCVRFGQEIAGAMELGAFGRGEHMHIATFVAGSVDSELSGNMIDLCPVGALTSKPYRYTARPWELTEHNSVSPHDCVGANVTMETRNGQVMRVTPRENSAVNETWIADRDRFSYAGLYHESRLSVPKIKRNGRWQETDWDTALTVAAAGLKQLVDEHGAASVGALGAYTATTEELYLLQRVMRGIGSGNVDYRLRQQDFSNQNDLPVYPGLNYSIEELESVDAALLIGSNIRKDQPLLAHRLRKATLNGARLLFVNSVDYPFNAPVAAKLITPPDAMVGELAAVAKILLELSGESAPNGLSALVEGVEATPAHLAIANKLHAARNTAVLLGNQAAAHPRQADLHTLAALIARLAKARLGFIAEGGNGVGAALAGAVPHREEAGRSTSVTGQDWRAMCEAGLKGFVLLGVEPELDSLDGLLARRALEQADVVVSLSAFVSPEMEAYATVLLPVGLFAETSGSFVNGEGRWQSFAAAAKAPGDARPAWKVLRVLGNLLDVKGFDYMSSEEVRDELMRACENVPAVVDLPWRAPAPAQQHQGVEAMAEFSMYATDPLVRRSAPLQQTADADMASVHLHPQLAEQLGLTDGDNVHASQNGRTLLLPLRCDARLPQNCALIPAGRGESMGFGSAGGPVELRRA